MANQTFQEMFQAARTMLDGKDPEQIAQMADVVFDGTAFDVPSLGSMYRFSYPDYICPSPPSDWHCLTILHYLSAADSAPVTGEACSMGSMPGGLIRGTKYDQTSAQALTEFLSEKSEEQVRQSLAGLGATIVDGRADLCAVLPFLPRFPLYLNIWFADEEFPPSARLLVDRCAGHYLTIEDAVTAGEVVLELLKRNA